MSQVYYDKLLGKLRDREETSSGGVTPEFVADAVNAHNTAEDAHAPQFADKVDKESGKGLSSNNYTTAEKNKLAGLSNYDDAELRSKLATKATPADITSAVNAHNTAGNAHSALFAATAKLTNLINPDSTAFAERILIGPTRAVKTLAEANRYMLTKTIGLNKGFDLVLDPGSYAGIICKR